MKVTTHHANTTTTINHQPDDIDYPSLTIGIPVFNEEEHIERVLNRFLNTDYPNLLEILVADGGSTDKTREIISKISLIDDRVRLIDNPDKYQSYGLNMMINEAQGEFFLRADGHCIYDQDYISNSVAALMKPGVRDAGGAQRYIAADSVQSGINIAVSSYLGNGGAKYMDYEYDGFADTVFLGCYRTEDLRKIGGYKTSSLTNEDAELNLRLIETFGNCIYISNDIKVYYYPRSSFSNLYKQYFRYGRGRLLTIINHPKKSPIRGLLPLIFALPLLTLLLVDFLQPENLFSLYIVGGLVIFFLLEMLRSTLSNSKKFEKEVWKGESKIPGVLNRWFYSVFSVILIQGGYLSGFIYQLGRSLLTGSRKW